MRDTSLRSLARLVVLLAFPIAAGSQTPLQTRTLTIAGQSDRAPVVQINGKSYVEIESLARMTHGSLRFQGNQIILTLPPTSASITDPSASVPPPSAQPDKPPQPGLSEGFLKAQIDALTQIRDWHVAIVSAVQSNNPVTENWVGPLRRSADSRVALATAAAATDPDRKAVELLRNQFNNMQQMSDQFLALHTQSSYTPPDSFAGNPLDQKIVSCEHALASMAATRQFQDDISCH